MRGEVRAISELNKGSTFTIEIPLKAQYSAEQLQAAETQPPLAETTQNLSSTQTRELLASSKPHLTSLSA